MRGRDLRIKVVSLRARVDLLRQLRDAKGGLYMTDILENAGLIGNGWEEIQPEWIGAMTDAPIVSDDATLEDNGDWQVGRCWWFPNYMVEDPFETLAKKGEVIFTRGDIEDDGTKAAGGPGGVAEEARRGADAGEVPGAGVPTL